MYVADKLVFVELHKTGGSHIGKWLAKLVPGEQVGKHNRVPEALWDRYVCGSIRNPWDWYVSLWAYGCSGRGSVHRQTTGGFDAQYLFRQLGPEMGMSMAPLSRIGYQAWRDSRKQSSTWQALYRDASDAQAFREWLSRILDPAYRFDIGEGYGFSPVSRWAGVLSYRYLKLFSRLGPRLYDDATLGDRSHALQAWDRARLVRFVIRNEHLEADLLEALANAGYEVTPDAQQQLLAARSTKTNTSKRNPTSYYYDAASIALIEARESLVIQAHGYVAPVQDGT